MQKLTPNRPDIHQIAYGVAEDAVNSRRREIREAAKAALDNAPIIVALAPVGSAAQDAVDALGVDMGKALKLLRRTAGAKLTIECGDSLALTLADAFTVLATRVADEVIAEREAELADIHGTPVWSGARPDF